MPRRRRGVRLPPHPPPLLPGGGGQEALASGISWRERMPPPLRRLADLVAGVVSAGEAWAWRVAAALRDFFVQHLAAGVVGDFLVNHLAAGAVRGFLVSYLAADAVARAPRVSTAGRRSSSPPPAVRVGGDGPNRAPAAGPPLVHAPRPASSVHEAVGEPLKATPHADGDSSAPPAGGSNGAPASVPRPSSSPPGGRILNDASVGANHPAASLPLVTPAGPSSAITGDTARRAPPAGVPNRDGADAVAALCYNAYPAAPSADQGGRVEGLPPGAEGRVTPVAMEHGDGALAGRAKKAKKGAGGRAAPGAKNAVQGGASSSGGKKLIDNEEYVEVVEPECEAHHKYVRKVLAWRKGFTLCLICHLEGDEKEMKADNDVVRKHCLGIHKGEGYKCQKHGCLARGKTKRDVGLHEIQCFGMPKRKC